MFKYSEYKYSNMFRKLERGARVTLKQLEAFYRAAVCDSFAIAADSLHISVSTLSRRISDLELSLGRPLFDRDQYRARLTADGQALLPHIRSLLDQADAVLQAALDTAGVRGHLRFAVGELASLTWLPRFVAVASERYPNLQLEPAVEVGATMQAAVESGEYDFAVISGTSSSPRIRSVGLGEARFDWVGAPSLVDDATSVQDASERGLRLITTPRGAGTWRMLEQWLSGNEAFWPSVLTCNTWGGVSSLLQEGVGVGFMPRAWSRPLTQRAALTELQHWDALPPLSYSMQMRRDDTRAVIQHMQTLLEEVVDFSLSIPFLNTPEFRSQP